MIIKIKIEEENAFKRSAFYHEIRSYIKAKARNEEIKVEIEII